jgi:hypothetical protein
MSQASFSARISKSAEILGVTPDLVSTVLEDEGLKDDSGSLAVLDASTTTIDDLVKILSNLQLIKISMLKFKAAASCLKGEGFEKVPEAPAIAPSISNNFVDAMKVLRPIQQWNDRELLEKYNQDKDPEVEQELHKRSSGRNFIVLSASSEQGKEVIDIENSLELLKQARKRVTPSFLPIGDQGIVRPIYPILSLNMDDRIVEICPLCNETLFKGYCSHCEISLGSPGTNGIGSVGIGYEERAYMRLVRESGKFIVDSYADRKALYASATKGLEDLKKTWPSIIKKFEELKMTNSLPKLRIVASRPDTVKDPFFADGNRTFGNKTY